MPFKFNAARRHRIPRARYRVQNWPQDQSGLKRRGDLTLWIDEAAIAGWQAPRRTTPGGQARYSDLAIQLVLMLRLVFRLALRQAEAFVGSVLRLLGLDLFIPDHTTLSRRSRSFSGRRPHTVSGSGANSRHGQSFVLRRADFKPQAPRSKLQAQLRLERPDGPVRTVPCGCGASARCRRS